MENTLKEETGAKEEKAAEEEKYKMMVAVANPESAISMVRTTYKLCGAKQASVELLHMVPVPDQVPLSDAENYMWEGREAIVESMMYLEPLFSVSIFILISFSAFNSERVCERFVPTSLSGGSVSGL